MSRDFLLKLPRDEMSRVPERNVSVANENLALGNGGAVCAWADIIDGIASLMAQMNLGSLNRLLRKLNEIDLKTFQRRPLKPKEGKT